MSKAVISTECPNCYERGIVQTENGTYMCLNCGYHISAQFIAGTLAKIKYRFNIQYQEQRSRYYAENLGNSILLKMVEIPGGPFMMGSPEDEAKRLDREGPQHRVTLSDFFMGMYPVTQAQWRAVASLECVNQDLDPDPSNFKGENCPVEQICWHDTMEFCARLSKKAGWIYDLPTEAEWEYACRAGTTTPFHFGTIITTDLANYDGNYTYNGSPKGEYRRNTTKVGHFPANAFGLYDMHGNVWEWCADHWHESYENKPEPLKENGNLPWTSGNLDADRSLRGGSWINEPSNCRSALRRNLPPTVCNPSFGFRVVCRSARTLS